MQELIDERLPFSPLLHFSLRLCSAMSEKSSFLAKFQAASCVSWSTSALRAASNAVMVVLPLSVTT